MKKLLFILIFTSFLATGTVSAYYWNNAYVADVYDSDYIVIIDDQFVEYGIGCLGMWMYDDSFVHLDDYVQMGANIYLENLEEECMIMDVEPVEEYYVENVVESKDEIIVRDKKDNRYLVEYGTGCLSMWRYEGKNIYIKTNGFLNGVSDDIFLPDRDDSCRVWAASELSGSHSILDQPYNINTCYPFTHGGESWFLKGGQTYYDIKCETLRDYSLEKQIENDYKNKCQSYSFNKLLVYNIKIGNVTDFLDNLEDKCSSSIGNNEVNIFIEEEKKLIKNIDSNLSNRLKGKILLQVEEHGEAWYVNPKTNKRYYMANGQEAYNIMRDLGVGITNANLDKVKNDNNFAKKHSGKIFLQVEDLGQAYYIDFDGNAHYLKDGLEAYNIMRDLGLGIKNEDLRKIEIN